MEIAMKSHIGCVRHINEDFYACTVDDYGRILAVVADGMGGHQAGDVASRMAVESILFELRDLEVDLSPEDERAKLMDALLAANEKVFMYAEAHPECSGMGTTVVAALIQRERGVTAHIGDSRLYCFGADGLKQHTEDHSLVQELLKSGQITEEEAVMHPRRNVLMRALGTEKDVRIDLGEIVLSEGDIVLLCSDGLTNKVPEEVMIEWLTAPISLQEKVDALVQYALEAGGEDNITCVAIHNKPTPVDVGREEG